MLAQKTRYALRSLLYIAEDTAGAPVQLARIAETQRVPPKYLELIMLDLKKAGLVASTRGPRGGYLLTRDPTEISFGEIVRAMEVPSPSSPAPVSISTPHAAIARTRPRARSGALSRSFATRVPIFLRAFRLPKPQDGRRPKVY
jgi:Rrf2 family protein